MTTTTTTHAYGPSDRGFQLEQPDARMAARRTAQT